MNINELSPEFLAAVCQYLNTDRVLHTGAKALRSPWEIDPGKLMAALEDAKAATTPTFTGPSPEKCPLCKGEAINIVDWQEYECYDCGKNFIWETET